MLACMWSKAPTAATIMHACCSVCGQDGLQCLHVRSTRRLPLGCILAMGYLRTETKCLAGQGESSFSSASLRSRRAQTPKDHVQDDA